MTIEEATRPIDQAVAELHIPDTLHAEFAGDARAYRQSIGAQPLLIIAALIAVYIVLGVLYESLAHPLTIISTLPSAGLGALLALQIFSTELSLIAFIGIILLIGIVKKNGIMMVDFALEGERKRGLAPERAIFEACLERFRPIMMTTIPTSPSPVFSSAEAARVNTLGKYRSDTPSLLLFLSCFALSWSNWLIRSLNPASKEPGRKFATCRSSRGRNVDISNRERNPSEGFNSMTSYCLKDATSGTILEG